MRELEKILEEIGELRGQAGSECTSEDHYIKKAWEHCLDRVVDIIRRHMNDGWIPVEERLPDNNENVLVTTDMGLIASGYIAHGTWITDQEPDYPIAWRSLPEPYKPKQPETGKYTGGSCCWPIDQCSDCPNNPERSENDQ